MNALMRAFLKMICSHRFYLIFICATAPIALHADTKERLIAEIVRNGTHTFQGDHHTVEIDDCEMRTFWRKQVEPGTWELWSSFRFDMRYVVRPDGINRSHIVKPATIEGDPERGVILFRMRLGTSAVYERSNKRSISKDAVASSRNDGRTHHVQKSRSFTFWLEGPGAAAKIQELEKGFVEYVKTHCLPLS